MGDTLRYRGDCTNFDSRLVYGPDMFGAHYRCIGAEFDPDYVWDDGTKGRTSLELQVVPPKVLAEMAEKIMASGTPLWEGFYAHAPRGV